MWCIELQKMLQLLLFELNIEVKTSMPVLYKQQRWNKPEIEILSPLLQILESNYS
jgi:hypothetical protein